MATYQDIATTEERLELLYQELYGLPENCEGDIELIRADIARDEALLKAQCDACGVIYRTRDEVMAWWDSLPTMAAEGASL